MYIEISAELIYTHSYLVQIRAGIFIIIPLPASVWNVDALGRKLNCGACIHISTIYSIDTRNSQ